MREKDVIPCCTNTFTVSSPLGNLVMKICEEGLHYLSQSDETVGDKFSPDKSQDIKIIGSETGNTTQSLATYTVMWLQTYFDDIAVLSKLALPQLCPYVGKGTFRGKVWKKLAEHVGPGCTVSYGELAKISGHAGAAQAVGTAMATNPFQIIVPCHRVIRNNGTIGQYARGTRNEVKLWLLKHEGISGPEISK